MNCLLITRHLYHPHFLRSSSFFLMRNGVRALSSKPSLKKNKKKTNEGSKRYADTLNLPFTNFPLSMKNITATEERIQELSHFKDLYKWQRDDQSRTEEFILHDGPPYANGDIHVGHTVNKIVKDITNRYKLLQGYRVHYIPGWDCHGLPIELKAVKTEGNNDPIYTRQKARKFAREAAAKQCRSFTRLGVMADWDGQSYFTDSRSYEATQLSAFWDLYEKGFVFEDYMPVYWSPSSRTAMAEAELEYNTEHISQAIHLRFRLSHLPDSLKEKASGDPVFALVWTTTPWSVPANRAICYSASKDYSLVQCKVTGNKYLLATECLPDVQLETGINFSELVRVEGLTLDGVAYVHPLSGATCSMYHGDHVTTDKGTGLVHTAPAHGHDDYVVALKHELSMVCDVDELGRYTETVGNDNLAGKSVLHDGNQAVLDLLSSDIVHQTSYQHSYPYDWRTHQPVIIRASRQWFIDTRKIRDRAMECVMSSFRVTPPAMTQALTSLLESRSRWCISRQRVWGVPIPVFYHPLSKQPLINKSVIEHVVGLVREHGSDCWWSLPMEDLLPKQLLQQIGLDTSLDYIRGDDIFDIWLDSGISWKCVLPESAVADVYVEGGDQFRGWFQASLLTSVALTDKSPYRNILVHGFTVDEEGKKMSKSLGNVVDPMLIVNGGKFQGSPLVGYGADVLRWWAGKNFLQSNVQFGMTKLNDCQHQVFKLRKTLRFLLGNLNDMTSSRLLPRNLLLPVDRYMASLIEDFREKVITAYDSYDYPSVLVHVEKFLNTHVSSFYLSLIKDRLYCDSTDSQTRRSCQTVLRHLYNVIIMAAAPILPHIVEEANMHSSSSEQTSNVFHSRWADVTNYHDVIDDVTRSGIEAILRMKDDINTCIKSDDPVSYDVTVMADEDLYHILKDLTPAHDQDYCAITELLQCSNCRLVRENETETETAESIQGHCDIQTRDGTRRSTYTLSISPTRGFRCIRCRRHRAINTQTPCDRCVNSMAFS